MPGDAEQNIQSYLNNLRGRLRGMDGEEVREIVEELRSHITEKASKGGELTAAAVGVALAALGSPEELASQYMADELLAQAEVSRSPVRILRSLLRWASLSLAGFLVLLSAIVGYFLGVVFMWCGILKMIHPHTAGLWIIPQGPDDLQISLRLGFEDPPAGGRELLGWWILPLGLSVGCGMVLFTTRVALSCARHYCKSHVVLRGDAGMVRESTKRPS